jgi:hypothetical protein
MRRNRGDRRCRGIAMTRRLHALLVALAIASFATAAAAQAPPAATVPAADIRADFDALYGGLKAAHYDLYARRPRAEYDALFARMRRALDEPLALDEVERRFQRFVAYGNVAHARIDAVARGWEAYRTAGGRAFPLSLRVVDGRVYVGDPSWSDGLAPGTEVLTIDRRPALRWLDAMRAHLSADNDYLAYAQLETRLPMYVWLARGPVDLRVAGVAPVRMRLAALDRAGFQAAEAKRAKRFALDWNARDARMLDDGIAYLRPGPFYDNRADAPDPWDNKAFVAFVDAAFARFIAAGAKDLIVDVRDNPGGDNSFSDPMIAWFATKPFRFTDAFDIKVSAATTASNARRLDGAADSVSAKLAAAYAKAQPGEHVRFEIPYVPPRAGKRFAGRVHLLVNRHSYSNTVNVAAIVQDYGFGKILGEETADLASTLGAMETFTLPRTGIDVGYPKARILRPNGDARARGVVPDVEIATPIAPSADDVVLERALERVRRARRQEAEGPE